MIRYLFSHVFIFTHDWVSIQQGLLHITQFGHVTHVPTLLHTHKDPRISARLNEIIPFEPFQWQLSLFLFVFFPLSRSTKWFSSKGNSSKLLRIRFFKSIHVTGSRFCTPLRKPANQRVDTRNLTNEEARRSILSVSNRFRRRTPGGANWLTVR